MSDDPRISVLLPTRGRPAAARRLLDSLADNAQAPDRIEVVLYLDDDDPASHGLGHPRLRVRRVIGERLSMGRMLGRAYAQARGDALFLLNDDVICRTAGWDRAVAAALERWSDGVALVYGNDLHQGRRLPTFPILTRTACELAGHVAPPPYRHAYIDTHWLDVFLRLRRLGHDRIVYLPEVVFEHLHAEAGKAPDRADTSALDAEDEIVYLAWADARAALARRLARHIAARMTNPEARMTNQ